MGEMSLKKKFLYFCLKFFIFFLGGKKQKIEKIIYFLSLILKQDCEIQQPLLFFLKKSYRMVIFVRIKKVVFKKFFLVAPRRLKKISQFKFLFFIFLLKKKKTLKVT